MFIYLQLPTDVGESLSQAERLTPSLTTVSVLMAHQMHKPNGVPYQIADSQRTIVKFLRHLHPLLSPSVNSPATGEVLTKVAADLDFYLPFRRHAPSLANGRHMVYANIDRFKSDDGVGFFNVLAFRGVFFGSTFAQSNHYRWFESLEDWERFHNIENLKAGKPQEEKYYVNKKCYGQPQKGRALTLLPRYWELRKEWNKIFNKPAKPTISQVFKWLTSRRKDDSADAEVVEGTLFGNIGELSALLICGDLAEAGIMPIPSADEMARLIVKLGKGAKKGMEQTGLIRVGCSKKEFCNAFVSLDLALQHELRVDEKEDMGYNVIMLEHTLCKIARLSRAVTAQVLYSVI
jgi:hypothetical protein